MSLLLNNIFFEEPGDSNQLNKCKNNNNNCIRVVINNLNTSRAKDKLGLDYLDTNRLADPASTLINKNCFQLIKLTLNR